MVIDWASFQFRNRNIWKKEIFEIEYLKIEIYEAVLIRLTPFWCERDLYRFYSFFNEYWKELKFELYWKELKFELDWIELNIKRIRIELNIKRIRIELNIKWIRIGIE